MAALDYFRIEKVTDIIDEIYDSGEIPEDLSRIVFIAPPNRPG